MRKIKKGDEVIILSGKSKGMRGKILKVSSSGSKVVVEGANLIKKHVKPNPNANIPGGIVEREALLHISKVAIYNPITGKADRVFFKILDDGKKVRCFRSNGEMLEV
jgi:large subunit ribosomal protein L24